jgi:hypothetical protein
VHQVKDVIRALRYTSYDDFADKSRCTSEVTSSCIVSLKDLILREDDDEKMKLSEVEFLKSLSVKQKQRLLR